jgi:hypothetical protein
MGYVGLCEYRPTGRLRRALAFTSSRIDSHLVGRWSKTPTNACLPRLPRKGLALDGIRRTLRVLTYGEAAPGLGIHIFANGQSSCRSLVEDPDKCLLTASARKGLALDGIRRTLRVPTYGEAAVGLGIHICANGQSSCRSVVEDPDKCQQAGCAVQGFRPVMRPEADACQFSAMLNLRR